MQKHTLSSYTVGALLPVTAMSIGVLALFHYQNIEMHASLLWVWFILFATFTLITLVFVYYLTQKNIALSGQLERKTFALAQSEERFKLIVQGSKVGIWDWYDVETDAQYWSPHIYHLLEYDDDEIDASMKTLEALLHPDDKERTLKRLHQHFNDKRPFDLEYRFKHKDGSYHWYKGTGQASWGPDGRAKRMIGCVQYIHPQKVAEFSIHTYAEELQRSNADLEQFAYVASHDLKAPLRAIHSLAEWIEENIKDTADQETTGYLDMLKMRVLRLEKLLSGLLNYSKIGSAKAPVELVKLNGLMDEVKLLSIPLESEIILKYNLPEIYVSSTEISHIFHNLVNNAVKHHDKENGTITIDHSSNTTHHIFSVTDDGPGIPENMRDRVFKMFQTLRPQDEVEGSGMGLAIVKKLVERRGGTIWLETPKNNKGLSVFFTVQISKIEGS